MNYLKDTIIKKTRSTQPNLYGLDQITNIFGSNN